MHKKAQNKIKYNGYNSIYGIEFIESCVLLKNSEIENPFFFNTIVILLHCENKRHPIKQLRGACNIDVICGEMERT